MLWQGALFGAITLASFAIGYNLHLVNGLEAALAYGSTMAFATLSLSQLVHAFNVRSEHSLFKAGFLKNKYMLIASGISVLLLILVLFTPIRTIFGLALLNTSELLEVVLLSILPFIISEIVKLVRKMIKENQEEKLEEAEEIEVVSELEEVAVIEDISSNQPKEAEKPEIAIETTEEEVEEETEE